MMVSGTAVQAQAEGSIDKGYGDIFVLEMVQGELHKKKCH